MLRQAQHDKPEESPQPPPSTSSGQVLQGGVQNTDSSSPLAPQNDKTYLSVILSSTE